MTEIRRGIDAEELLRESRIATGDETPQSKPTIGAPAPLPVANPNESIAVRLRRLYGTAEKPHRKPRASQKKLVLKPREPTMAGVRRRLPR